MHIGWYVHFDYVQEYVNYVVVTYGPAPLEGGGGENLTNKILQEIRDIC